MNDKREFGSDFHLDFQLLKSKGLNTFFTENIYLTYSGRSALRLLLEFGIKNYDWKKLYVPNYFCHEVFNFIRQLNITLVYFQINPFDRIIDTSNIEDSAYCVFLNVDYFGLGCIQIKLQNAFVIEDLTHSIHSVYNSQADFCFGSLRKSLPIPVGGFIYSKKHEITRLNHNDSISEHAIKRLLSMYLKSSYLKGETNNKIQFRELFMETEEDFKDPTLDGVIPSFVKQMVYSVDVNKILLAKEKNCLGASKALIKSDKFLIHTNQGKEFSLILEFLNEQTKEQLKTFLISKNIYPFTLWPNQLSDQEIGISNRLLFIHLDYRYNSHDVKFICEAINSFFIHV